MGTDVCWDARLGLNTAESQESVVLRTKGTQEVSKLDVWLLRALHKRLRSAILSESQHAGSKVMQLRCLTSGIEVNDAAYVVGLLLLCKLTDEAVVVGVKTETSLAVEVQNSMPATSHLRVSYKWHFEDL